MKISYSWLGGSANFDEKILTNGDFNPAQPQFNFGKDGTTRADTTQGLITVPTGVSSFTISYNTFDDLEIEGTESVQVEVGNQSSSGFITDGAGRKFK